MYCLTATLYCSINLHVKLRIASVSLAPEPLLNHLRTQMYFTIYAVNAFHRLHLGKCISSRFSVYLGPGLLRHFVPRKDGKAKSLLIVQSNEIYITRKKPQIAAFLLESISFFPSGIIKYCA